jgi:hypothetical protein
MSLSAVSSADVHHEGLPKECTTDLALRDIPHPEQILLSFESTIDATSKQACVQSLKDFWATPSGKALSAEVALLAEKFDKKLEIHFTTGSKSRKCTAHVDDKVCQIFLNLSQLESSHFRYLVRTSPEGQPPRFDFVDVKYPLSVAIGHEMGHIRQFLLTGSTSATASSGTDPFRPVFLRMMRPVAEKTIALAKQIAVEAGEKFNFGIDQKDENYLLNLDNALTEMAGPQSREGKVPEKLGALRAAFRELTIGYGATAGVWGQGQLGKHCELPNILPFDFYSSKVHLQPIIFPNFDLLEGLIKRSPVMVSDGQFLGEVLALPQAFLLSSVGPRRRPEIIGDLGLLEARFRIDSHARALPIRWGLSSSNVEPHDCSTRTAEYRDKLITCLLSSLGVDPSRIPPCNPTSDAILRPVPPPSTSFRTKIRTLLHL